jgi:microcystin-dependent protein
MANTANFNWTISTVGGSNNTWGAELDTNLVSQDTIVKNGFTSFIGTTAPTFSFTLTGMLWLDNTSNPFKLNIFDGTNWVPIGTLDDTKHTFTSSASGFFIGDYKQSSQTANHGSWLLCDGSAVSRTTFSGLFNLYNGLSSPLPFGAGDGSTTFNLPDARGAVIGNIGTSGLTQNASNTPWSQTNTWNPGKYRGEESHILVSLELPDPITQLAGVANFQTTGGVNGIQSTIGGGLGGQSGIISNMGGNQPHNTMQPTLFTGNYFVYTGV